MGKNRFLADFAVKTFFFTSEFVKFRKCFEMKTFVFLVFTLDKVFVPPKIVYAPTPPSRYFGAGPGDTNDSILYDHAKYVILLEKVKIVLNSSCNLEL